MKMEKNQNYSNGLTKYYSEDKVVRGEFDEELLNFVFKYWC